MGHRDAASRNCKPALMDALHAGAAGRQPVGTAPSGRGSKLGGIVGGRQRWVRRERPQCRPQLENVGAGLGRAWAKLLLSAALKCCPDSALQSFKFVAAQPPLGAPAEHHEAQPEQAAPDLPGHALALANPVEVAQQVALQAALSRRLNPS